MQGWGAIALTGVAATGNLKQLYPALATAGAVPTGAPAQSLRKPVGGKLGFAQVETDSINGGIIEIWDVNGEDIGADVSSTDVITNAQLVSLQALGRAYLVWSQNFTSTAGAITPSTLAMGFVHGLAARYIQTNPAATCALNLNVEGGYFKIN